MIIKLSDYIMEQEVSDASVASIEEAALIAETEVCDKIAAALIKECMMKTEMYMMEADGATDDRKWYQKLKDKLGDIWTTIIESIKAFFRWIGKKWTEFIGKFKKKGIDEMAEKIDREIAALDEETSFELKKKIVEDVISKGITIIPNAERFKQFYDGFIKLSNEMNDTFDKLVDSVEDGSFMDDGDINKTSLYGQGLGKRKIHEFINDMNVLLEKMKVAGRSVKKVLGKEDTGRFSEKPAFGKNISSADNENINESYTNIIALAKYIAREDFSDKSKDLTDKIEDLVKRLTYAEEKYRRSGKRKTVSYATTTDDKGNTVFVDDDDPANMSKKERKQFERDRYREAEEALARGEVNAGYGAKRFGNTSVDLTTTEMNDIRTKLKDLKNNYASIFSDIHTVVSSTVDSLYSAYKSSFAKNGKIVSKAGNSQGFPSAGREATGAEKARYRQLKGLGASDKLPSDDIIIATVDRSYNSANDDTKRPAVDNL